MGNRVALLACVALAGCFSGVSWAQVITESDRTLDLNPTAQERLTVHDPNRESKALVEYAVRTAGGPRVDVCLFDEREAAEWSAFEDIEGIRCHIRTGDARATAEVSGREHYLGIRCPAAQGPCKVVYSITVSVPESEVKEGW